MALLILVTAALGCIDAGRSREDGKVPARIDRAQSAGAALEHKPIRLAVVTDLHGVLEPCGCTRASAGGADRIAALLGQLRRGDPELQLVLAGDSLFPAVRPDAGPSRVDAQQQLQANAWAGLLRRMRLDAIAPGPRDFANGASALAELAHESRVAFVGAAPRIEGLDRLASQLVHNVGSRRVALVAGGTGQRADLTIFFRQGEARLDEPATGADVVIYSGLSAARSFASLRDGVLHMSAGRDGEELVLLELWPEGEPGGGWRLVNEAGSMRSENRVRVERHRLTRDRPRDPEVRRLLEQLFLRVNTQNRELAATGPMPGARQRTGHEAPAYMGARTCAACHTQAYFAWRDAPHGRAYQTLVARGRELDLDCIGCHVTGFDQPRGAALGHLEELLGVGCESCHGPGEAHVNNPHARQRTVHRAVPEATCRGCHDSAHSDAFDYDEMRQRLLVPGHGAASAPVR